MDSRWNNEWETASEVYSANQVESVLDQCGVEVVGETSEVFTALCPFHGNTATYAFAVNKVNGKFICFNPGCAEYGELVDLVRRVKKVDPFAAHRLVVRAKTANTVSFEDRMAEITAKKDPFIPFDQAVIDKCAADLFNTPHALEYMHGRGFEDGTLKEFEVGYSNTIDKRTGRPRNMIVVPMHDPQGGPIGLVGRTASHEFKDFKNSYRLPRKETLFNLHRAKRSGDTVIVVEASFDVMRVTQAGYPNVVAILGGSLSPWHAEQFNRYFSTVIIMTDYDDKNKKLCRLDCPKDCPGHRAGRRLADRIVKALPNKRILWSLYSDDEVYPHHAKDPGDCTDDEIRHCLKNAATMHQYYSLPVAS